MKIQLDPASETFLASNLRTALAQTLRSPSLLTARIGKGGDEEHYSLTNIRNANGSKYEMHIV